jgi:hypothetical protein
VAVTLNPTKMHPQSLVGCLIIIVVVVALYHFTLGHRKAG